MKQSTICHETKPNQTKSTYTLVYAAYLWIDIQEKYTLYFVFAESAQKLHSKPDYRLCIELKIK